MELDRIRGELTHPRGATREALAAAVDHAEALAEEVIDIIDLACKGVTITPPQQNLLFYGAFALAAARRAELYEPMLSLIEWRSLEIELWFGDVDLAGILISTCGPEAEPPYDLLENPGVEDRVKCDIFLLIARMVWEGRWPRDQFVAFLDRFEREAMAPAGDLAWIGWYTAIELLGLTEFEARGRAGAAAGRMPYYRQADYDGWAEALHRIARHGAGEDDFATHLAQPIADVPTRYGWMRFREPGMPAGDGDPLDPAADICLDQHEIMWLGEFLLDDVAPGTAMSLECLDGYVTGLAAGPEPAPDADWQAKVWSDEDDAPPEFETEAQAAYLRDALDRHRRGIRLRLEAGYPLTPLIDADMPEDFIADWAFGFVSGQDMSGSAWKAAAEDKGAGPAFLLLLMLLPPETVFGADEHIPLLAEKDRRRTVERLPEIVQAIHGFFHGRPVLPLFQPRRGPKIGRNEPCPCGSGRKYKKCCGAAA